MKAEYTPSVMDKLLPDWTPVDERLPDPDQRVEVSHALSSKSYNCSGYVDEEGEWHCSNGFVYPLGKQAILSFQPTHWRALTKDGE